MIEENSFDDYFKDGQTVFINFDRSNETRVMHFIPCDSGSMDAGLKVELSKIFEKNGNMRKDFLNAEIYFNIDGSEWKGTIQDLKNKLNTDIKGTVSDFMEWSLKQFPKSTPEAALIHLKREVQEVEAELKKPSSIADISEELADCLGCIFSTAARLNISAEMLFCSLAAKLEINKGRQWKENEDLTYSHIKNDQ